MCWRAGRGSPEAVESDEELVRRCRAGRDEEAFGELVRRHREAVFRLAVSILGVAFREDAEEVTQEVFLRVHHSLGSFRGEARFSSWVYRITFNLAVNLKERVRYRTPHLGEEALAGMVSPQASPVQELEVRGRAMVLDACMDELPEVYQSSLRLHYWMGRSVAEIAELLGVPENSVKSYLFRARRLLEEMLKERGVDHA